MSETDKKLEELTAHLAKHGITSIEAFEEYEKHLADETAELTLKHPDPLDDEPDPLDDEEPLNDVVDDDDGVDEDPEDGQYEDDDVAQREQEESLRAKQGNLLSKKVINLLKSQVERVEELEKKQAETLENTTKDRFQDKVIAYLKDTPHDFERVENLLRDPKSPFYKAIMGEAFRIHQGLQEKSKGPVPVEKALEIQEKGLNQMDQYSKGKNVNFETVKPVSQTAESREKPVENQKEKAENTPEEIVMDGSSGFVPDSA